MGILGASQSGWASSGQHGDFRLQTEFYSPAGIVDLSPHFGFPAPEAQRLTVLGELVARSVDGIDRVGFPDLVWYFSYGSNMDEARFRCYIEGGRPAGSKVTERGCSDTSPPRVCGPLTLPGVMYFGDYSTKWIGGVAFYDPFSAGVLLGKAYLITLHQFRQVTEQDGDAIVTMDHLDTALAVGSCTIANGDKPATYDTIICPGELAAPGGQVYPVLTFTASRSLAGATGAYPEPAYAQRLITGLVSLGLSPAEADTYLFRCLAVNGSHMSGAGGGPASRLGAVQHPAA